jgi:nitroimidazol reductase NimA-like FMN-containing flavoprotein (pyridoxamine 5'-phosphate oxidase superfamily)
MRRREKEILDPAELAQVFDAARTLVLGIADEGAPYLVPLFFGPAGDSLYVHSGPAGTKMELLARSPRVSFAAVEEPVVLPGDASCRFTARSRSVVGYGTLRIVTDEAERTRGLDAIVRHYTPQPPTYDPGALARTVVLAIDIETVRGKRTG